MVISMLQFSSSLLCLDLGQLGYGGVARRQALFDDVLAAIVGGVEYLVAQAHDNPKAFLSLLGRIMN
jgi:hypothetical protein